MHSIIGKIFGFSSDISVSLSYFLRIFGMYFILVSRFSSLCLILIYVLMCRVFLVGHGCFLVLQSGVCACYFSLFVSFCYFLLSLFVSFAIVFFFYYYGCYVFAFLSMAMLICGLVFYFFCLLSHMFFSYFRG